MKASLLALLVAFCLPTTLCAQEPTDPIVTEALAVLNHYDGLVQKLEPGDVKTAQTLIDGIDPVAKKLQGVKDKTHADFITAAKKYQELRAQIIKVANQPKEGNADLQSLHKDVLAAFSDMKTLRIDDLKDANKRRDWEERLASFKARHKALGNPTDTNVKLIGGNIEKLDGFLKDALTKVDAASDATEKEEDPNRPLTSEEVRARHERKRAEAAKAREKAIAERNAQAAADSADGAEIMKKVEAVKQKYYAEGAVPERLEDPLTPEFVQGWAARIKVLLETIPKDVAYLETFKGMKNADQQKVTSAIYWIGSNLPRNLEEMKNGSAMLLDGRVEVGLDAARFIATTDVKDEQQVMNRLLGEGTFEQQMNQLQTGLQNLEIAEAFDQGIGRKGGPDRAAQKKELEEGISRLRELSILALDQVRMPKAVTDDDKLVAAFKEVTQKEKYGFGKILKSAISYKLVRREKKEGWIEPGTVNATISLYNYVWDEFGVTTAEREGDEIWLYFNKLKFYHSGDSTTPIDVWILSRRLKTTQILEKNL